jgi:TldD protein
MAGKKRHLMAAGGRKSYKDFMSVDKWKYAADEALREGLVNLEAVAGPAGEMDVVLGSGWPGIFCTKR